MPEQHAAAQQRGPWWPAFALVAAVMAMALLATAAAGHRFGILPFAAAILFALGATLLAAVAMCTAVLGLLLGLLRAQLAPLRARLAVTAALALVVLLPMGRGLIEANRHPRIHDVSTDTMDPPALQAAARQRPAGSNDTAWDPALAAVIRAAWPDLGSLELPHLPPADVYRRALQAIEARGWQVLAQDPAAGTIEAVARSRWFGFADDVVVRIRPLDGGGSRVDMRSASRVGVGDLGVNAARIRALQQDLVGG